MFGGGEVGGQVGVVLVQDKLSQKKLISVKNKLYNFIIISDLPI